MYSCVVWRNFVSSSCDTEAATEMSAAIASDDKPLLSSTFWAEDDTSSSVTCLGRNDRGLVGLDLVESWVFLSLLSSSISDLIALAS